MEREVEGAGSGSQQVTPDQGSPNAEDGAVSVRPLAIGESPQRSQDKLSAEETDRLRRVERQTYMGG